MPRPKKQPPSNGKPVSKMDAVRQAIAEGHNMPSTGLPFIKERFGLVISKSHFSNYKTTIKGQKRGRKPGHKPKANMLTAAVVDFARSSAKIDIETISQVKALCGRIGADTLKKLVELVG